MSETEKKLEQARYFFKRMLQTHLIPSELECNLQAFITFARSITFVMQKEYSKNPKFKGWYETKQKEMSGDELLNFFNKARTKTIHEKSVDVGTLAHIKSIYLDSVPSGWGFVISGKGEPIWITPKGERVHAYEFDKQVERIYLFDNPPKRFLGSNLKDFSAVTLCRLYLAYLSDLTKEVVEKFGGNKP